ncbi:uncharacterized protein ALTATR162_LOCUS10185 [Alternaria atra]|uniref:Uncharacterized protein n=1 Tax=Alternaria atra TaxID=119953 RepID=A0A8J2N617_9PLEO|nr:uncharacterized protein ALTATR162_LOCUS10185 [Alternaria atra]CAG5182488.1 unnamed protein product [Alternaria atra]
MKLIAQRGTVLTISNSSKKAMLWVYKYMQASEHDSVGIHLRGARIQRFDIYQHCGFLECDSLKKRIFSRLKSEFYNALPIVDEIELYQTSIPTDREIEVVKNGEALATCDREVRKGKKMRTNLIV